MADPSDVDKLLENVEQFVNDENKIVTYEFLSQNCGIHVNLAKTVLEKYVEELKKKKNDLLHQVVYSLAGYVDKNIRCLLVKDTNLEETKLKLDKIISLHVYSVQKGKLDNLSLLYNSNLTEFNKSIQQCCSQSGISCPAAKLKPRAELAINNTTEVKKNVEPIKPEYSLLKKEEENLDACNSKPGTHTETHPQEPLKAKEKASSNKLSMKKPVGKPAIAAFFANQQAIGRVNPVKEEKKEAPEEIKKSVNGKRVVREPSDDESENKDINVDAIKATKRFKLSEEVKPVKSNATKTQKVARKAKRGSKTSEKTQRKRIQQFSDSESSGDDEEEQDIVLSLPEIPTQMPAPMSEDDDDVLNATVIEPSDNPKRNRKLVTKTYMDKDGFVVTKREFETCEEEEIPDPTPEVKEKEKSKEIPKADTQPKTKHPSPPGKTKQKSITSFFTRK
ncbi:DNA polymerase delta subunit 3-like [Daphnia carinata]|uniref:DNA polymerase delta subunit 3-like n=1 Tax=Daphnia carinata TaxID=120202 RepID=UPI00257DBBDD|nr:DNA polymerase delta subunit 3-like [Daphnia carinata]